MELSDLKRTLREVFDIERLRPGQEQVMRAVLEGRNTLAIMPTGAGKSLCYQLPGLHITGTTVVVSPLISLMKDQVDKLEDKGLEASQVNSTLTEREEDEVIERIEKKGSEFVFTTPERLADPCFIDTLSSNKIDFLVIDEAHCISEWGHDFRPAFLELSGAIKALGRPPVLALTATATEEVIQDIKKQLDLPDFQVINMGIYRSNLRYEVVHVTHDEEKQRQLARLLNEIEGTGIIYTSTIKHTEAVTDFLKGLGLDVVRYHGRLSARERKENQERFMAGEVQAMVATNAFGMGIDKGDIRFVIHYNMPGTLESYYQESGRAGRDGELARCILLYDLNDRRTHLFFMGGRYPKLDAIIAVHNALKELKADETPVKLTQVQEAALDVAKTKTRVILSMLKDMGVVEEGRGASFKLLKCDIGAEELERMSQRYQEKAENDHKKLERMMYYAQSALCRWKMLLTYFDEEAPWESCNNCDNCLHPIEKRIGTPTSQAGAQHEGLTDTAEQQPAKRIREGNLVTLPKYGKGQVQSVEGDQIVVAFPDGEVRRFKRDYVK